MTAAPTDPVEAWRDCAAAEHRHLVPFFAAAGEAMLGKVFVELPLDERRRAALHGKAEAVRGRVEDALPSRAALRGGRRQRSVVDLEPFPALHALLAELRDALLRLGEAHVVFAPAAKAETFDQARRAVGQAIAALATEPGTPPAGPLPAVVARHIERLESEVLPRLAGLVRWAERLGEEAPRA